MALIDRDLLTCIGVVIQAHGIKGEVKVNPVTDTPAYYENSERVILETGRGLRELGVREMRSAGGHWIMALDGVVDRDEAESLCGAAVLLADAQLRPLEPGEVFQHDLIGCVVQTMEGRVLGAVREIMETGANDVLLVDREGGELMVPMTAEVVREVDTDRRIVRIEPLPGLLDRVGE